MVLQEDYVVKIFSPRLSMERVFRHLHGTGMLTNWRVMFTSALCQPCLRSICSSEVEESPDLGGGGAEEACTGYETIQHRFQSIPPLSSYVPLSCSSDDCIQFFPVMENRICIRCLKRTMDSIQQGTASSS